MAKAGKTRTGRRSAGVAAVLAMLFLVIFASLGAAMAIVSQGNLATADAHLKVNRSLAAAETGLNFVTYRIEQVVLHEDLHTRHGEIRGDIARDLWQDIAQHFYQSLVNDAHHVESPAIDLAQGRVDLGRIELSPGGPTFTGHVIQHPVDGENYDDSFYDREPYVHLNDGQGVSASNPLGHEWIRVEIEAQDGGGDAPITRTVRVDFLMEKRIPYAILSRSRVMLGQHVMIDGPIGSRFMDTHLEHGHPVHMVGDFDGLSQSLDDKLEQFRNTLITNDQTGNNRLRVADAREVDGISDPEQYDHNGDGYIDEWDIFIEHFGDWDSDLGVYKVSRSQLQSRADSGRDVQAAELFDLIYRNLDHDMRPEEHENYLTSDDIYAKVRGQVHLAASKDQWEAGLADWGPAGEYYQDYFQGPIHPDYGEDPLRFEADETGIYEFDPDDFDVSDFYQRVAGSDIVAQAQSQADADENARLDWGGVTEEVPYGAAHPYEYYDRPVFENMTFENVKIPKGLNALFINCTFKGVTFVEVETDNTDPNFNYAGMMESDGTPKFPDMTATVDGQEVSDTRDLGNNIRFDNCTFEGAVISGGSGGTSQPQAYTHVRNKMQFTGNTQFDLDAISDPQERALLQRSTLLAPHYSVEMGTFQDPSTSSQALELSGTIVAGILDLRGNVDVNGTILSTFAPEEGVPPVIGETTPWFNMAIGYFGRDQGDMEADMPEVGRGQIHITYDPTLALPDGIRGPVSITPRMRTYFESGAH